MKASVGDLQEVRRPLSGVRKNNTPTFTENDAIRSRCALRFQCYTPIATGMEFFAHHDQRIRGENACPHELGPPVYKLKVILLAATSRQPL